MEKNYNLSKSRYCNGLQCPKMLWLDEYKSDEKSDVNNDSVLDNGTEVGIIAKDLFENRIDIEFNSNLQKMIDDTKNALNNKNIVITEASFTYENNFCSVDILVKNDNDFLIYEVKSSTEVKDIYIEDLTYQVYILKSLGYHIKSANIVYINSGYTRCGELNLKELFKIKNLTKVVNDKLSLVKDNINSICTILKEKEEPKIDLDMHCVTPYECPFFKYCTRRLPENNVFKLRGMANNKKFSLYKSNIYSYEDLLKADINEKYKQQIEFELFNKEDYIDKDEIKKFLDTLSYPLYFLDFETFQQAIPKYDGIKPYMQIPFQYSLHYIKSKNSKLEHKEFLAEANFDPRRNLAESLVKDIPKDVCTLAYNMSFEKTVIKNLAYLYPDLADHLMNIHDNIKDLMLPFYHRNYYTKSMFGSYSIKYVLPALFPSDDALNYHNLDLIHNGSEAMNAYANLGDLSEEEQIKIRNNLLKYCELDTFAMVKIWQKLQEQVETINN